MFFIHTLRTSRLLVFLLVSIPICYYLSADYGISYDENLHKNYGNFILLFYSSFGKNPVASNYADLMYYGGFYDVISQSFSNLVMYLFDSKNLFEIRHFFNGFVGLFVFYFIFKISELAFSKKVGILGCLILLLTPEYTGHLFFNPKDIPFSTFYLGAVYFFLRYKKDPNRKFSGLFLFSMFTGFAIGIRILGIVLWPIFGFFLFLELYNIHLTWKDRIQKWLKVAFPFFLISYISTILFWPFLLKSPLNNAFLTLKKMANFPWQNLVKVNGEFFSAPVIGRKYLPTFFSNTLPDFYFFILLVLFISIIYFLISKRAHLLWKQINPEFALLVFTGFGILILLLLIKPVLYNGYRQVFFLMPPISIVIAKLWIDVTGDLKKHSKLALNLILFLLFSDVLITMYRMHPYEYVYFNRTVAGGMHEGAQKFDVEYWATSTKEGSLWLKEYLKNSKQSVTVSNSGTASQSDYYLNFGEYMNSENLYLDFAKTRTKGNLFELESLQKINDFDNHTYDGKQKFIFRNKDQKEYQYMITTKSYMEQYNYSGNVIHTINKMGMPIAYVLSTEVR